jgi:hypothetical protein
MQSDGVLAKCCNGSEKMMIFVGGVMLLTVGAVVWLMRQRDPRR